jgi:hypothetical protein
MVYSLINKQSLKHLIYKCFVYLIRAALCKLVLYYIYMQCWRYNTQHDDIQQNDTQYKFDIQHNDAKHSGTCAVVLNVINAEYHLCRASQVSP